VRVILTDGDDAGSKTTLVKAVQVMYAIGQLLNMHTKDHLDRSWSLLKGRAGMVLLEKLEDKLHNITVQIIKILIASFRITVKLGL
jgi:hypothetical protein